MGYPNTYFHFKNLQVADFENPGYGSEVCACTQERRKYFFGTNILDLYSESGF
jgi:hypothetical protein